MMVVVNGGDNHVDPTVRSLRLHSLDRETVTDCNAVEHSCGKLDYLVGHRRGVDGPRRERSRRLDAVIAEPADVDRERDEQRVYPASLRTSEPKHERVVVWNRPSKHQSDTLRKERVGRLHLACEDLPRLVNDAHTSFGFSRCENRSEPTTPNLPHSRPPEGYDESEVNEASVGFTFEFSSCTSNRRTVPLSW